MIEFTRGIFVAELQAFMGYEAMTTRTRAPVATVSVRGVDHSKGEQE